MRSGVVLGLAVGDADWVFVEYGEGTTRHAQRSKLPHEQSAARPEFRNVTNKGTIKGKMGPLQVPHSEGFPVKWGTPNQLEGS